MLPEVMTTTSSAKDREARQPGGSADSLSVGTSTLTGVLRGGRLAAARDALCLFPADACMRG